MSTIKTVKEIFDNCWSWWCGFSFPSAPFIHTCCSVSVPPSFEPFLQWPISWEEWWSLAYISQAGVMASVRYSSLYFHQVSNMNIPPLIYAVKRKTHPKVTFHNITYNNIVVEHNIQCCAVQLYLWVQIMKPYSAFQAHKKCSVRQKKKHTQTSNKYTFDLIIIHNSSSIKVLSESSQFYLCSIISQIELYACSVNSFS